MKPNVSLPIGIDSLPARNVSARDFLLLASDAFFQLVLWPIRASATVNEIYVTAGLNRIYAAQGRGSTNTSAERVRELFHADEALSRRFNEEIGGGRWRHFADQTHLGYTSWKDPPAMSCPR